MEKTVIEVCLFKGKQKIMYEKHKKYFSH